MPMRAVYVEDDVATDWENQDTEVMQPYRDNLNAINLTYFLAIVVSLILLLIYYTAGWGVMSFHYFMLTVFVIGVVCLLALCLLRSSAEQALRDSMEGRAILVENNFSASYYDPEQGYMSNQAPRQAEYFDPRGGRSRRSPGSAPVTGMPVPNPNPPPISVAVVSNPDQAPSVVPVAPKPLSPR